MTLTGFSRDDIPHQGEDLILPCFPVRAEDSIGGRQIDYLQNRLQAPGESDDCGRFFDGEVLTTFRKTTMRFIWE